VAAEAAVAEDAKRKDNGPAEEVPAGPPAVKAKAASVTATFEEQQKRVFNMGDDGWQDASVPGSAVAAADDEVSEIGPDGKRLSKKELKKLQRDREIRKKDQVCAHRPFVIQTFVWSGGAVRELAQGLICSFAHS
jgi:hypothetical protein